MKAQLRAKKPLGAHIALPESYEQRKAKALEGRLQKMLEEHVSTKLAAFDTDAKVRAAKSKKYNDRAGYLAFLTASKDKKYAAEAAKVAFYKDLEGLTYSCRTKDQVAAQKYYDSAKANFAAFEKAI